MGRTRLFIILGSLSCAAGVLALSMPACAPGQCTQSLIDPNQPSPALECAAGNVCYQGQCIRACSAGQEGAEMCTGNSDCSGSRSNCVAGFCSACVTGEFCVPTLNVCQVITMVTLPPVPPPPPPGAPKPPAPLDAGYIDGGLRLEKDSGVGIPVQAVVTYAGLVDIAEITDYTGGGTPIFSAKVTVEMLDVSAVPQPGLIWRVDPWDDVAAPSPPATEVRDEELGEECALLALTSYTGTVSLPSVSFGDITIQSAPDFPGSLAQTTIDIPWNDIAGEYDVPGIPQNTLVYSVLTPQMPRFLAINGDGSSITNGNWPDPAPDNGLHVPFLLEPSMDTRQAFESGFSVGRDANGIIENLVVSWDPIRLGVVPGEVIALRFRTANWAIDCRVEEGNIEGAIVVKSGLIQEFINESGLAPNAPIPIYLERVFAQRLEVPTADPNDVIDVAGRVRHTFVGDLRFQ